jgi:hypothetical protein
MLDKIKKNFNTIALIVAAVGLIFILPALVNRAVGDFTLSNIIYFIEYGLFAAALIIIIISASAAKSDVRALMPLAFMLYLTGLLLYYIYLIIEFSSWSTIIYAAIVILAAIFYLIPPTSKAIEIISWVLLIALLVMGLLGVFAGDSIGVTNVSVMSIVIFDLYLYRNKKENE